MKDQIPDKKFWDIADSFINLANEHAKKAPRGKVSAAMLYAAARYNAFIVAMNSDDLPEAKESATEYFIEQYKKMLVESGAFHQQGYPLRQSTLGKRDR